MRVLDRILRSVEDQVAKGGLSSKQVLDLSRAAKEVTSARAAEDKLDPEPIKDQKPDERGYLDVGLGDIKIHKDDPLLEDFKRIEAKGLVGRSQDPPEAEFNGEVVS